LGGRGPRAQPPASSTGARARALRPARQAVVTTLRKLRADYNLVRQRPACFVAVSDAARAKALAALAADAATLSTSSSVEVLGPAAGAPPAGCSVAIVDDVTTVHMLLKVTDGDYGGRGWGRLTPGAGGALRCPV
jgi:hypothetical protein